MLFLLIISNFLNPFCRRQQISNWSATKENHDPIAIISATTTATATSSNTSSKSSKAASRVPSTEDNGKQKNQQLGNNSQNAADLFELLERCQSQRLDDQRCVLPSYFSQVSAFYSFSVLIRFL